MPIFYLPYLCATGAMIGSVSMVLVVLGALKRHRMIFWIATMGFLGGALACHAAYDRLERIHGELFRGNFSVETKADLLTRFGSPSHTRSYIHDGRTIECWIYAITALEPHIQTQFEMFDGKIIATISTTHI